MAAEDVPVSPGPGAEAEDHENAAMLKRLWQAQVRTLLAVLENTKPEEVPAAVLNVERQTLADSNITADSLKHAAAQLRRLRQYETAGFDGAPFRQGDGSEDFQ
jgi:hypothetical protein